MRYSAYLRAVIPVLIIVALGCSKRKPQSDEAVGTPAATNVAEVSSVMDRTDKVPNFSWTDGNGKMIDYDSYHGKLTLINFWATWCGPCRKELPDLAAISREFADRGVRIIGISEDRGPSVLEDVRSFVKENGIPYQVLVSTDELEESFRNVRMLPTTFLVDDAGTILHTFVGPQTKPIFTAAITAALK